jgi:serine/threonine protein kinase
VPALVLTKLQTSFDRRIAGGATLDESLRILLLVLQRLAESRPTLPAHGALKHQNVLLDDRGQVVLSDVATPTLRRHYGELLQQTPALEPWVAPETRLASAEAPIGTITDTYAVGMMLLARGACRRGRSPVVGRHGQGAARRTQGTVQRRLRAESSNPRFHARVAERLGRSSIARSAASSRLRRRTASRVSRR